MTHRNSSKPKKKWIPVSPVSKTLMKTFPSPKLHSTALFAVIYLTLGGFLGVCPNRPPPRVGLFVFSDWATVEEEEDEEDEESLWMGIIREESICGSNRMRGILWWIEGNYVGKDIGRRDVERKVTLALVIVTRSP